MINQSDDLDLDVENLCIDDLDLDVENLCNDESDVENPSISLLCAIKKLRESLCKRNVEKRNQLNCPVQYLWEIYKK